MLLGSITTGALAIAAAFLLSPAQASFEQDCTSLASRLSIPDATIWFSEYVSANTNLTFPENNITCQRASQVISVDICRVALYVSTSSRSGISMEAWLPRTWSGRFLSTGNGGISGCIQFEDMNMTASLGFATVGANNGHNGTGGTAFLNNPDVVLDFSWRSLHINTVVGKQITEAFYTKPYTQSYYLGCSTGGRQGIQSAQLFPDDFDGIVAGAPAIRFNYLNAWSGFFYPVFQAAGPEGFPPESAWPALDAELLKQCDALDGAEDGILETPDLCTFRPEALICPTTTTNTSTCITGTQASTIRTLLSDLHGENGTLVYPRMQPGATILSTIYTIYSQTQFPYTADWFKYAVFNDPGKDTDNLTPQDWTYAWTKNPGNINAWDGNLLPFKLGGGKLLHYHGQIDPIISSTISPLYYDHVSRTMNLPSEDLDSFYRFFRISGMAHCEGGPGAYNIGNKPSTLAGLGPEENVLMAMVRWVEEGVPPETISGTKFVGDGQDGGVGGSGSREVEYTRRHCRYPYRNVFIGGKGGDWKDADLWQCVI